MTPLRNEKKKTAFRKMRLWTKAALGRDGMSSHQNSEADLTSPKMALDQLHCLAINPVKWKTVKVKSFSRVQLFATSWTVAHQAPLSMGILQARILEWIAISFSRGSSWFRDQTRDSCIAGRFFTNWATFLDISCSWIGRINTAKMSILPNPYQNSSGAFHRNRKKILKFIWNQKRP